MKKITAIILGLCVAGSVFARGGQQGGAPLIGIAMPETHVERWVKDGNHLRDAAIRRGFRAEVQWANASQATQNQQIQSFLTQGARVIIVGSVNEGVASVVAEAAREGVAIIAYDRIISNSRDYDYYITFNNFEVGRLQGQSIANALNLAQATTAQPRTITLFAGSPTDGNAFFFFDGAMSVLTPFIDRGVLRVVGPHPRTSADVANFQRIATENWQAPIARARMDNLLTGDAANVVLDAVLAPNDTLARAIIESLRADARYQNRLPIVTGQDAEFDSMMSIRNGDQHSTVFKDTGALTEAAILLAYQIINNQPRNLPGAVLATGDLASIGDTGLKRVNAFLLAPVLVTRENLMVPVNAGFYDNAQAAQLRQ